MQLFYTYFVLVSIQLLLLGISSSIHLLSCVDQQNPPLITSQFGTKSTLHCLFVCLFLSFFLLSFAYCRLKRDSLSYSHHLTSWLLYAHCLLAPQRENITTAFETLNQSSVGADSFHLSWSLFFVSHCIIFVF